MSFKHTSTQILGRQDPTTIAIAKAEYESLVRAKPSGFTGAMIRNVHNANWIFPTAS